MKKLIAIAVLCAASVAMADLTDVGALLEGYQTSLVNYGDENVTISAADFHSWQGLLEVDPSISSPGYISFGSTTESLTVMTSGLAQTLFPGESMPLGQLTTVSSGDGYYWRADFYEVGSDVAGAFELVPEPASMGMIALGCLAIIRRRR